MQRFENGFLQTVETEAWSIWTHNDHHGNRWPTGLSINARIIQQHDGTQLRFLMVRKDERAKKQAPAIYDHVRYREAELQQRCVSLTLVADGQSYSLPVRGITVRALTNEQNMPIPPTDSRVDPVESMVRKNSSDAFVISSAVIAQIEPYLWRSLGSTQSLSYELCGEAASATATELEALREVIMQRPTSPLPPTPLADS